jgi:hypothetical protein
LLIKKSSKNENIQVTRPSRHRRILDPLRLRRWRWRHDDNLVLSRRHCLQQRQHRVAGRGSRVDSGFVHVTVNSTNGPRTFTVPLATQIGSALDTLPSDITSEVSLALWPMVAGVKGYSDVAGKLTAGQFPPGIWPVHFKYTQKVTTDRNDPTNGATSSSFACSLDLVAGALVATVDGRTFSAPIEDLPTYTADSFGNPATGDGYRVLVVPTLTAYYGPATQRYLTILAETYNAYVDPTYGPKNAGPSLSLSTIYSGFIPGTPAGSTTMFVKSTDTKTGVFTSYRCKDQLV